MKHELEVGYYVSTHTLLQKNFVGEVLSFDDEEVIVQLINVSDIRQPIKTLRKQLIPHGQYKVICNPFKTAKNILKNRIANAYKYTDII